MEPEPIEPEDCYKAEPAGARIGFAIISVASVIIVAAVLLYVVWPAGFAWAQRLFSLFENV